MCEGFFNASLLVCTIEESDMPVVPVMRKVRRHMMAFLHLLGYKACFIPREQKRGCHEVFHDSPDQTRKVYLLNHQFSLIVKELHLAHIWSKSDVLIDSELYRRFDLTDHLVLADCDIDVSF